MEEWGEEEKKRGTFSGTELLLTKEANLKKLIQNVNRKTESSHHDQTINSYEM